MKELKELQRMKQYQVWLANGTFDEEIVLNRKWYLIRNNSEWIAETESEIWNQNTNKTKYTKTEKITNHTGWYICDNKW